MRGQADYGALAPKETSASVSDMGEIAARLGSIVIYDKRGDVVDFDNFEEPIEKWYVLPSGVNGWAILTSDNAKSGCQSVNLAGGSDIGDYCRMYKSYAVLSSKSLGIEISYSNLSAYCDLYMDLFWYDGINYYRASCKLDPSTGKLYVLDDTNSWVEIGTVVPSQGTSWFFHTFKLVANFDTHYYKRIMYNNVEYDISTIALYHYADTTVAQIFARLEMKVRASGGGSVYLDDFIFTQVEP
jgi:hypothetical protein